MPIAPTTPRPRTARPTIPAAIALATLLAAAATFTGGCYRKVVGARGVGAATVDIEEPNNPDGDPLRSKRLISPLERRGQTTGW